MPDREKVLKALRCLSNPFDEERDCDNCSYDFCSCVLDVTADALELLNAQEPVKPEIGKNGCGSCWYICPECRLPINYKDIFCRHCGRKVKWYD